MKIIRYQGIARWFSFWWARDFDFWWLISYSTCCGVLKPFYPAYSPLICFKYKNNLADAWVNISLGCSESLIKKLLSILSMFPNGWDSKPIPWGRTPRAHFTTWVKFTLFRCVPQNRRQQVNGKYMKNTTRKKSRNRQCKISVRDRNTRRSKVAYQSSSTYWSQDPIWATVLLTERCISWVTWRWCGCPKA